MANSNNGLGLGFAGFVLFVVFLVLKLCKVIAWSWWWVTAPLWIPAAIYIVVLVVAALIAVIVGKNDLK